MTRLETLEQQLYDSGLPVLRRDFKDMPAKALYVNGRIFLSRKVRNAAEKRCILAEEFCHHCLNCGNILRDEKQEAIARRKAYEMLVPLDELKGVVDSGCRSVYDLADYFDVTEDVAILAVEHYRSKGLI